MQTPETNETDREVEPGIVPEDARTDVKVLHIGPAVMPWPSEVTPAQLVADIKKFHSAVATIEKQ
ncbi:MAG: hypothetical protein ACREP1_13695 [Rhodanobacteraceae bacterium]